MMDNTNLSEELDVIQSIYSISGECQIENTGATTIVTLALKPQTDNLSQSPALEINMVIQVDNIRYPEKVPLISVSSAFLQRQQLRDLRQALSERALSLQGQLMFADLVALAQNFLDDIFTKGTLAIPFNECQPDCSELNGHVTDMRVMVLHLDHMRAKQKYIKTITNWTVELGLKGRLLFCGRLILLLLQGTPEALKSYLMKHKGCKVDVDSKGRSCKEKMMSVLCDVPNQQQYTSFETFEVLECKTTQELYQVFSASKIEDLFEKYVKTLPDCHLH